MVDSDPPDEPGQGWSTPQTVAQYVLFAVILGLVWVDISLRKAGTPASSAIGGPTFGLLALAGVVIVLPRLTSFSFEGLGFKADLAMRSAVIAGRKGLRSGGAAAALAAQAATPAIEEAESNPRASIDLSRRALAAELASLAETRGVAVTGELASTAKALADVNALDAATADAVSTVAAAIARGQQVRRPTPALAIEVDYATQLVVGQLRAARLSRAPRAPGSSP